MLDEVLAVPEFEYHLILGIRQDRIRPWTAYECIATRSPGELVIAITTLQHVVPGVAPQEIVPSFPVEGIVAKVAMELVVAVATGEVVIAVLAPQEVVPGVTE